MPRIATPSQALSLRQILPDARFPGCDDIPVTSVCSDWRACREGDVFVALLDSESDGHDHIATAVQNGAIGVIAERLLPTEIPMCLVEDSREALGFVSQALAGTPSTQVPTVGVTGSVGKTVTSMLIASVFEAAETHCGLTTTIAHSDSVDVVEAEETTSSAPEMANWLSRMASRNCAAAVLELSSEALADRRLTGIQLKAAVLTNVRRDHLALHGGRQNYLRAKSRIFDLLAEDGFAVVNIDDPGVREIASNASRPFITYGIDEPADISATILEQHPGEQSFLITAGSESAAVRTRMIGNQHVYNCLAATAVGVVVGLDLTTIVRGLEAVEYVPGRMQRVEVGQDFQTYVDYARTADALTLCLNTVRRYTSGRVICVYGAPGDAPPSERPRLGRAAERFADVNIITSNNPGWDRPLDLANDTLDGYRRPAKALIAPDRKRAIEWAIQQAEPGDAVVIAGKGHEDFQLIRNKRLAFDDVAVAKQAIRERDSEPTVDAPVILPFPRDAA